MTPDELAYNKVKEAKKAILAGDSKPQDFPNDLWREMNRMFKEAK
jgi:hypothetical protein